MTSLEWPIRDQSPGNRPVIASRRMTVLHPGLVGGGQPSSSGVSVCCSPIEGLHVDDQPGERNGSAGAQQRESKPKGNGRAPRPITNADEPWAAAFEHNRRIGNLRAEVYEQ